MATLAGRETVFPFEQVLGIPVMVEGDRLPSEFTVTLLAPLAELRPVNVVFLVTGITGCRCLTFV